MFRCFVSLEGHQMLYLSTLPGTSISKLPNFALWPMKTYNVAIPAVQIGTTATEWLYFNKDLETNAQVLQQIKDADKLLWTYYAPAP